jgi:hypothetical protein
MQLCAIPRLFEKHLPSLDIPFDFAGRSSIAVPVDAAWKGAPHAPRECLPAGLWLVEAALVPLRQEPTHDHRRQR